MEVNKIAAHIRFSKDIGGSWKSVELSAEASVSDREHWKQSQSQLYFQLTDQLRQLWNNANGAGGGATRRRTGAGAGNRGTVGCPSGAEN